MRLDDGRRVCGTERTGEPIRGHKPLSDKDFRHGGTLKLIREPVHDPRGNRLNLRADGVQETGLFDEERRQQQRCDNGMSEKAARGHRTGHYWFKNPANQAAFSIPRGTQLAAEPLHR
jgi:hypothetical protein